MRRAPRVSDHVGPSVWLGRTLVACWVVLWPIGALAASPSEELTALQQQLADAQRRAVMAEVEVERLRLRVRELEAGAPALGPATSSTAPRTGTATTTGTATGSDAAPGQQATNPPQTIDDGIAWSEPATADSVVEEDLLDEELLAEELAAAETTPDLEAPQDSLPATPAPTVPTDAAALDLYDRGYALFHQEHYREAEALFEEYIGAHSQTELADNALFWIGECRYARGDYEAALEAFTNTVVRFPEGNKVPDALLKAGKSLEALGQLTEARATYQELTANFPGSLATLAAEERLAALPTTN